MSLNRTLSLLVTISYFVYATRARIYMLAFWPILGLGFIWFPNVLKVFDVLDMGSKMRPMDPNTPSVVYVLIGWAILLGPAFVVLIGKFANM